jgi:hypothetical protein
VANSVIRTRPASSKAVTTVGLQHDEAGIGIRTARWQQKIDGYSAQTHELLGRGSSRAI